MSISVGIVGLPNVGKSTLFNALLQKQSALAANYPFATIEPNVGVVAVPDHRLPKLAQVVNTTKIVPATVEFYDIAGLVKGASQGAGLGNKFLSHIREVNVIAHVVRAFNNHDIVREGSVSPIADYETIETELQLADLSTLQKQSPPKGNQPKELHERWQTIQSWKEALDQGTSLRGLMNTEHDRSLAKELSLLTAKPQLIVANVDEEQLAKNSKFQSELARELKIDPSNVVVICARLEEELAELENEDKEIFLKEFGQQKTGLENFIIQSYQTLGLQSFYTAGELEARAWTINQGTTAQQAAGVIHSDFAKKFIAAHVVDYQHFIQVEGWKNARDQGLVRQEGRNYIMQSNDVVEFAVGR